MSLDIIQKVACQILYTPQSLNGGGELFLFSRTLHPKLKKLKVWASAVAAEMADGILEDVIHGLLGPSEMHLLIDTALLTTSSKGPITIKQFKKRCFR